MEFAEMEAIVAQCVFPGYIFKVWKEGMECYLQAHYQEADVHTGLPSYQYTRRWLLSPKATVGEIVQTAFKCILTSAEHRTREFFRYNGRAVFGPHLDIGDLWEIAADREVKE